MAKIIAPNKKYNDTIASVRFTNGVGETTDSSLIEWFKEKGYSVEEQEQIPDETPISKMKIQELQELAKEKGIEGYENMKKDELLKVMKE